jgi:hypothetical protein
MRWHSTDIETPVSESPPGPCAGRGFCFLGKIGSGLGVQAAAALRLGAGSIHTFGCRSAMCSSSTRSNGTKRKAVYTPPFVVRIMAPHSSHTARSVDLISRKSVTAAMVYWMKQEAGTLQPVRIQR